jgi:sulfate adenylyltransferase large subunit
MDPLSREEAGGLLRFTTAGSVDDGKSTLIGRMLYDAKTVPHDRLEALERLARHTGDSEIDLSLLTDGLTAEREQGITIDVAYSYFATPRRKFIIADTPGHEQYTRNMITGASTADAAVILVDVRGGVTVQTRRHLYLSHLLGVPHLVIAVNKMDLVGYGRCRYQAIARAVAEFAAAIGAAEPHAIPISAKHGDNVVHASARMLWYTGPPLLALLEALPEARLMRDAPFRLPVQLVRRVVAPDGTRRRQYLGRIASGCVRNGDPVAVMPSGIVTRVRRIATFDGPMDAAAAPKSVIIEVEGDVDIARGDVLAALPARPSVTDRVEATICWLCDRPFSGQGRYLVRSGTRRVAARIAEIRHRLDIATLKTEPHPALLERNDIAQVRLVFAAPQSIDSYQENRATGAFIVIDEDTNTTVAAGMYARPREAGADAKPAGSAPACDRVAKAGCCAV